MPQFVVDAPRQCKSFRQRIRQSQSRDELAALWYNELKPYVRHAFYMLRGATKWFDYPAALLRKDLTELVGEAEAGALLSNLSDDAELLASLGPVVAVAKVATGQRTREEYLERFGHRGPHEWELSVPQPAEDPDWLDRQLAEFAESPVDVDALLKQGYTYVVDADLKSYFDTIQHQQLMELVKSCEILKEVEEAVGNLG